MKRQIEIELTHKEKTQLAYEFINDASLLEKARLLSSLVAKIDSDTLKMYMGEKEAPSKREVGEIVEIFGYKIKWIAECGRHLKKFCSKDKWMNNLDNN